MVATAALLQGLLWMAVSALTVALLSAMAKFLEHASSSQILLLQMAVSALVFGGLLVREGRSALSTRHRVLHLARGVLVFAAWYLYFVAIDDIPLMDGALLSNTVPLWVPFIAWIWLRQRPSGLLWIGVVVGTIGVALVMHPTRGPEVQPGTLLALASGVVGAVGFVAAGMLGQSDRALLIAFTGSLIATLFAAPYAAAEWQMPDPKTALLLVGIGVVFAVGSYAATTAVGKAPPAIVTPVAYLAVVFTMLIDLLVFGDPPDPLGLFGAALVIAGGTWVVLVGRRGQPASPSVGEAPGGGEPHARLSST
jgi:drug/metabolite transporter (DMT)-like permease